MEKIRGSPCILLFPDSEIIKGRQKTFVLAMPVDRSAIPKIYLESPHENSPAGTSPKHEGRSQSTVDVQKLLNQPWMLPMSTGLSLTVQFALSQLPRYSRTAAFTRPPTKAIWPRRQPLFRLRHGIASWKWNRRCTEECRS